MMKKICALLLALCLTLTAATALAATQDINFGDFTIPLDPETPGKMVDKEEGQVLMTIYPAYLTNGDSASNFNAAWESTTIDIASQSMSAVKDGVDSFVESVLNELEAVNVGVSDFDLLDYGKTEVDGLAGIYMVISYTADYSGMGEEYKGMVRPLFQKCVIVSGSFGTYTFTATCLDMDTMNQFMNPIFDSIRWN